MKKCAVCNETKPYSEFYKRSEAKDGYGFYCKPCKKSYLKKDNQGKKTNARYYQKNKEKIIANARAYEIANREKVRENHRLYMQKRRNDPKFRLKQSIMALINHHLQKKTDQTNEYLGCTYEEYYLYLEKQFDKNMNWDNYGRILGN